MAQERVYTSNHISQGDKCTGSKHKKEHTEVLGIERGAEYGTSAEQFADSAKQSESQGETDAAAQSVEGGVEYSVYHNQRNEKTQALLQSGGPGPDGQLQQGHESGYDDNEDRNTHLIGHQALHY